MAIYEANKDSESIVIYIVKTSFGLQHYTHSKLQSPACSSIPPTYENNLLYLCSLLFLTTLSAVYQEHIDSCEPLDKSYGQKA